MCGIVGYVGKRNCTDVLINGLSKLEYRGYDSAGIAVFQDGKIAVAKSKGRLKDLEDKMEREGRPEGNVGIGHTRWATHGEPSDVNSHPHSGGRVTIVHNGIIENYKELKDHLASKGVTIDRLIGGLDEYAIVGDRMKEAVDGFGPDLTIILGICHAYPGMGEDDILITDQPRQLANYLNQGCRWAVGEISSHTMVMGAHSIVPLETADTLREMLE